MNLEELLAWMAGQSHVKLLLRRKPIGVEVRLVIVGAGPQQDVAAQALVRYADLDSLPREVEILVRNASRLRAELEAGTPSRRIEHASSCSRAQAWDVDSPCTCDYHERLGGGEETMSDLEIAARFALGFLGTLRITDPEDSLRRDRVMYALCRGLGFPGYTPVDQDKAWKQARAVAGQVE